MQPIPLLRLTALAHILQGTGPTLPTYQRSRLEGGYYITVCFRSYSRLDQILTLCLSLVPFLIMSRVVYIHHYVSQTHAPLRNLY